jgi:glycerate kinase
MSALRVLVGPDSYKGSLTSVQVARALADGWSRGRPDDPIALAPLADGGEGTLDAIDAAGGWITLPAAARDPLMRPMDARFLRQGERAVVELAIASGLSRVAHEDRDGVNATTFGTGQVLAAAIGLGCRDIVLGLGGSATTDGGAGLLVALGARLFDSNGNDLPMGGGGLGDLARVDLDGLSPLLADVQLTIASDVSNPLLGESGAAAIYGPQKGLRPADVARLDGYLSRYADLLESATGLDVRDVPGAGAAGGTTASLFAIANRFASFQIRPGIDVVMELTDFDARIADSDLAISGEGRIDAQTAFGKTCLGVARKAAAAGIGCICFGGSVTPEGESALRAAGAVSFAVMDGPTTVEAAMSAGVAPLERAAERAARLWSLAGTER